MFTDNIDLIRSARQLPSGEVTHIVFVSSGRLLLQSDAFHAGLTAAYQAMRAVNTSGHT